MNWAATRRSEWVLLAFFTYVVILVPFFPGRPQLGFRPLIFLALVAFLLRGLAEMDQRARTPAISVLRDWLPLALTLIAFREMELFAPLRYDMSNELAWIALDRRVLDAWRMRAAIEFFGPSIAAFLELCYLLVYGVGAYCIALLYFQKRRQEADRFNTIYLIGTLTAYALFPFFPSQPPRIAFPEMDPPSFASSIRVFNLYLLRNATIHTGVFPSAHVSSAFAAGWALFLIFRKRKLFGFGLLIYSILVSIATIYGRYHYAADVLAGIGISLIAGAACFLRAMGSSNEQRS